MYETDDDIDVIGGTNIDYVINVTGEDYSDNKIFTIDENTAKNIYVRVKDIYDNYKIIGTDKYLKVPIELADVTSNERLLSAFVKE